MEVAMATEIFAQKRVTSHVIDQMKNYEMSEERTERDLRCFTIACLLAGLLIQAASPLEAEVEAAIEENEGYTKAILQTDCKVLWEGIFALNQEVDWGAKPLDAGARQVLAWIRSISWSLIV
ncbi:hypothetical protein NL676_022816 [Syzygium grande]|nr:hypothetical protein NL676_022816 [Syzygium grande]